MASPIRKKAQEKALELKKKVGKQPPRIKGSTYVTKKGDTLSDIADKMGLTVRQIRASNPDSFKQAKAMNEIKPGMRIKLPTVKSAGGTQDYASKTSPKKVYDLSKEDMKAIQMNRGGLKTPTNPGLKKLPTAVRNKMGYMKSGGVSTKKNAKKKDKGIMVVSISVGKMSPKKKKKATKKA